MYDQGPVWVPPTLQFMEPVEDTDDAEDADSDYSESDISSVSSFDSDEDYDKLEEVYTEKHPKPLNYRLRVKLQKLLQRLTLRRSSIAQALVFCMIYSYGAEDLIEWVLQSLLCHETPLFPTKLARFYLLSDLLYNSANSKANVWRFRALLEPKLSGLFYHLGQVSRGIPGRLRQDQFRQIFMATLEVWGDWALFPRETLAQLEESYQSGATREESFSARLETQKQDRIGLYDPVYIEQDSLVATKSTVEDEEEAYAKAFKKTTSAWVSIDTDSSDRVTLSTLAARDEEPNADLDGNPMEAKNSVEEEDDDIDGIPFTITSQSGTKQVAEEDVGEDDEDIDGVPFTPSHKQSPEEEEEEEEDLDGVPFVRSQEDEEDEDLDGIPFSRPTRQEEDDDDIDGIPLKRPPSEEDDRTDFGDKVSFKPMLGIKRWKGRMDLSTASDDEDATE